jgi:hypothetical protein
MNTMNNRKNMKTTFLMLTAILCMMNVQSFAQGVGISESSITPDASAILELRSTTRGLLLPRLTTTNRDLISTLGMALYNSTTNSIDFNNGSWNSLATLASPTFTGTVTMPTPFTLGATSVTSTGTQLNYLNAATGTTGTASTNLVFSASPTFTGTVILPTPFTLGATSVTSTGTQMNYLNAATGTTGTTSSNVVFSASPTFTGTVTLPTPFTLGATSVTSTGTQLNYLNAATGTTGTASTNVVYSTAPTLTGVTLAAGTITVDPLTFASGANLTTPASGAVEFDGTTFYQTTASGRGVAPSTQIAAIQAAFTLANATGVQSCLTATNDVLTVQGSTTYLIEGQYLIANGTTNHTTAMAFALGGGASVTSFEYTATLWSSALNAIATAQSTTQVSGVASKVLNANSNLATTTIIFSGIVRMNAGGTITPQIAFSALPGGTNQMKVGSYIKFTPVGSGTVTSVGNWN